MDKSDHRNYNIKRKRKQKIDRGKGNYNDDNNGDENYDNDINNYEGNNNDS